MRMRYALIAIVLGPIVGTGFLLVRMPDARAAIAVTLVCEALRIGTASGAITAEGRQKLLSEMINSSTLNAEVRRSAEMAQKRC